MWGPGKATHRGKVESVVGRGLLSPTDRQDPDHRRGPRQPDDQAGRFNTRMVSTWSAPRISPAHRSLSSKRGRSIGRDPDALEVSVLDTPLLGKDRAEVAALVEANRGRLEASVFAATPQCRHRRRSRRPAAHAGGLRRRGGLRVAGGSHLTRGGCRLEACRRSAGLRPARINPARSTHWLDSGWPLSSLSPRRFGRDREFDDALIVSVNEVVDQSPLWLTVPSSPPSWGS